jgi:hypothetical protein
LYDVSRPPEAICWSCQRIADIDFLKEVVMLRGLLPRSMTEQFHQILLDHCHISSTM